MGTIVSVRTLFERQLVRESKKIVRKGLSRVYAEHLEQTSAVRGRVLVRENLGVPKATLFCRYAELSFDTPENRILRHAISNLDRNDTTHRILRQLAEVPKVQLSATSWTRPKYNRLNQHYKRACDASRILTIGVPRHIRLERGGILTDTPAKRTSAKRSYPDTGESGETYDVEMP